MRVWSAGGPPQRRAGFPHSLALGCLRLRAGCPTCPALPPAAGAQCTLEAVFAPWALAGCWAATTCSQDKSILTWEAAHLAVGAGVFPAGQAAG